MERNTGNFYNSMASELPRERWLQIAGNSKQLESSCYQHEDTWNTKKIGLWLWQGQQHRILFSMYTVDGSEILHLLDRYFIPLFMGFYTSQVVGNGISSINTVASSYQAIPTQKNRWEFFQTLVCGRLLGSCTCKNNQATQQPVFSHSQRHSSGWIWLKKLVPPNNSRMILECAGGNFMFNNGFQSLGRTCPSNIIKSHQKIWRCQRGNLGNPLKPISRGSGPI